jgi:squalene-hopene/tetraprenyl-beta-curcumene cyclase
VEETAIALNALALTAKYGPVKASDLCLQRGISWLLETTRNGTHFPTTPIGLYFARLWYHERLYPVIWTLQALQRAKAVLSNPVAPATSEAR